MNQTVLKIKNLSFGYTKDVCLYDNFSLSLKRGEIISIVGKSGSGKSTLFELITGTLTPKQGSIKVKRISQIYQDPYTSFHQSYSIADQIKDVVDNLENTQSDLSEYTNKLKLPLKLLKKKPFELSGGQLQRCSILRALLMKPDIILADEITSALDNIIALEVMQLLMQFLDRVGILLITHNLDLANWCSTKILKIPKNHP